MTNRADGDAADLLAMAPVDKRAILVREQAFAKLRAAIAAGRYRPGERLIERELCDALGISRPTLREAMRKLEAEKLVFVEPHRGPVVAGITAEQAQEIYKVRSLLEPWAMQAFIEQASDHEFAALHAAYLDFEHAANQKNLPRLVQTTERFYNVLLSGAGNECLREILEGMMARISYLRARSMSNPGRLPASLGDMKAMTAAIIQRNIDLARKVCLEHIHAASQAAIRQIEMEASNDGGPTAATRTGQSAAQISVAEMDSSSGTTPSGRSPV